MSWPPTAQEFYRPPDPDRPLFQGDVFEDVPFVKARLNNRPDDAPNVVVERRAIILLGYPCDLYTAEGLPAKVQAVAAVTPAGRLGIPDDWSGAYNYAPLPGLINGQDHAVALQAPGNIDARYLTRDRRIACLSEMGWAVLRHRIMLCAARTVVLVEELMQAGRPLWAEVEMWHRWTGAGRPEADFVPWFATSSAAAGGFSPRDVLHRHGNVRQANGLLDRELEETP